MTGAADINLETITSFGGSASFPSLSSDINIDWGFSNTSADLGSFTSFGDEPTAAFNNVKLDAGSFFNNFTRPILTKIQEITRPIQPIVDVLTRELPGFSEFSYVRDALDQNSDGKVTLLDLVETISPDSNLDFIQAIAEVADLVNKVPTDASSLAINLGGFDLGNTDVRSVSNLTKLVPNITEIASDINSQLQAKGASSSTIDFVNSLSDSPAGELKFPILTDPSTGFKLLLGQTADLFTYDMPALKFGFDYEQFFSIIGPLGVQLRGEIGANIDLAFGYDTFGLQQFATSNNPNSKDIFNGFFISDRIKANGTGADVAEVVLNATIAAGAVIDLLLAKGGVEGGIQADVSFNLNDTDGNGKVRVNEILNLINKDPRCLFDTSGKLTAFLAAFYDTVVTGREEFGRLSAPLLDFTFGCRDTSGVVLAQIVAPSVLRLNMGASAGARIIGDVADGNETFLVEHESGSATDEAVDVSAFGARKIIVLLERSLGTGVLVTIQSLFKQVS